MSTDMVQFDMQELLPAATDSETKKHSVNPGGGYSREFWIGVCREGLWTLTLSKSQFL